MQYTIESKGKGGKFIDQEIYFGTREACEKHLAEVSDKYIKAKNSQPPESRIVEIDLSVEIAASEKLIEDASREIQKIAKQLAKRDIEFKVEARAVGPAMGLLMSFRDGLYGNCREAKKELRVDDEGASPEQKDELAELAAKLDAEAFDA